LKNQRKTSIFALKEKDHFALEVKELLK